MAYTILEGPIPKEALDSAFKTVYADELEVIEKSLDEKLWITQYTGNPNE